MKLEVKHLTPYLPYGIQIQYKERSGDLFTEELFHIQTKILPSKKQFISVNKMLPLTNVKPILRPISSMNEEECAIYNEIQSMCHSVTNKFYDQCYTQAALIDFLASRHFDMFGLIVSDLAIDINTLNQ